MIRGMQVSFAFFLKDQAVPFSTPQPICVRSRAEARQIAQGTAEVEGMGAFAAEIEQLDGEWRARWTRDAGWVDLDA